MNFWDERFSNEEFVYGIQPNNFFKAELDKLKPGTVLLPGEGEGRQACYAASMGWKVHAFDSSKVGMEKALILCKRNQVSINYSLASYLEYQPDQLFDAIGLVFTHADSHTRRMAHKRYCEWLKPGGKILLQGYRKEQLGLTSGGPQNLEMLFSKEELKEDFAGLSDLNIQESDEVLSEGPFHQGLSRLISLVGTK